MRNFTSLAHVGPDDEVVEETPPRVPELHQDIDFFDGSELSSTDLRTSESWRIALLVLSSINVSLVLLYWLYILYISFMKTNRWRPPLLPHTLLGGLLLAAAAGFTHLSPDNPIACQGARLTTPLAYTVVYSSLLVRLVCLRSLHRGVYLPTPYQALLLLFCVLVQVSMSVQWFVEDRQHCRRSSPLHHLLSTLYPLLLYILLLALATLSRKAREHYNEARSIWWALLTHLPLWIGWSSAGVVLDSYFHLICGFGLEVFVLLTLVVHLLPRSSHLVHLSRDGYNKFENELDGMVYGGSKSSWEPSFSSWKTKEKESSSYLGFHRPTRVVPPSSSSLSHSTFAPNLIYPDRYSYVLPPQPYPIHARSYGRPYYSSRLAPAPAPSLSRSKYNQPQPSYRSYQMPAASGGYRVPTLAKSYRDTAGDYYF